VTEAATRVLLVEDDDDDYALTRDLLAQIADGSYTLDRVTTFDAGLAAIRARRHDVYLIDYRLGAESGLDLPRALLNAGCHAPIILLTGQGDPGVDSAAMQAGASDYLVKGEITAVTLECALRHARERERILRPARPGPRRGGGGPRPPARIRTMRPRHARRLARAYRDPRRRGRDPGRQRGLAAVRRRQRPRGPRCAHRPELRHRLRLGRCGGR